MIRSAAGWAFAHAITVSRSPSQSANPLFPSSCHSADHVPSRSCVTKIVPYPGLGVG
jgi:hypothetical protein